jgi:hypothetical protein
VRGRARAFAMPVVRWRAAEPRGGVARAREGQGGGARAVAGVQVMRGAAGSWRWRGAAGNGGRRRYSRGAEEQSRAPEEEEEERGSEGLICKNRKIQGPHCKLKFPTDPKA